MSPRGPSRPAGVKRPPVPPGSGPRGERVLSELTREGLLLLTDGRLPSVAALVAGAPVRGSWWAHPAGRDIFRVSEDLADHPDVLVNRLVSGKVTYVHRRLWPLLLAVARARDPWQMLRLSRPARSLLLRVTRAGTLRTDRIAGPGPRAAGAARELEDRLLVHAESVHTERGSHARVLESWDAWARRRGAPLAPRAADDARDAKMTLERIVAGLNARCGGGARLPWQASRSGAGSRPGR